MWSSSVSRPTLFRFCPGCASPGIVFDGLKKYSCSACGFLYFHNAAAAVMCLLEFQGKVLFVRRNREPGEGRLDLPGGFVDPGENGEEALCRELKEELGIRPHCLQYMGTSANNYPYQGVIYQTCDLVFRAELPELPRIFSVEEIRELLLLDPVEVADEEVAFPSVRDALRLYLHAREGRFRSPQA